jgi:hypothetical protein
MTKTNDVEGRHGSAGASRATREGLGGPVSAPRVG